MNIKVFLIVIMLLILSSFVSANYDIIDQDSIQETREIVNSAMLELPDWEANVYYTVDEIVIYNNQAYRIVQSHTSQAHWLPDVVPALYTPHTFQTLGELLEWKQPIGASDAYNLGDRVYFTINNEKFIYETTIDANVWSPTVYGWTEVGKIVKGDITGESSSIDFLDDSTAIFEEDLFMNSSIIAINSEGYNFNKELVTTTATVSTCIGEVDINVQGNITTQCLEWVTETKTIKEEVFFATLNFNNCVEGSWHRIYKTDIFQTSPKLIRDNGYIFKDAQCVDNKISFQVDSFSSYTQSEIDDLVAGLVSYYDFDSDATDSVGSNDGTVTDAIHDTTDKKLGAGSYDFDSDGDWINLGTPLIPSTGDFTIALWLRTDTPDISDSQGIVAQYASGQTGRIFNGIRNDGKIDTIPPAGDSAIDKIDGTDWHFVMWTRTGSDAKVYVNNVLAQSHTLSTAIYQGDNTYIGGEPELSASSWDGNMDEIGFWTRVLDSDDRAILYNEGTGLNPITYEPVAGFPQNVSYLGVPIDTPDFSFADSDYTLFESFQFNTSETQTNLGILSSFNLEKITGTGTSDISLLVEIDGVELYNGSIRTATRNEVGVSGIPPILLNVSNGEHELNLSIKRTGVGTIAVSNLDFSLGQFISTAEESGRGNLTTVEANFNSPTLTQVFTKNINKTLTTTTYIGGTFSFNASGTTTAVCRFEDGGTSPYFAVDLTSTNRRTVSTNYMTEPESISNELNISCFSTNSVPVSINGSFIEADMRDDKNNTINHIFMTNSSTNYTNYIDLTAGHTDFLVQNFTILNGTSPLISSSITFNSQSGDQTPSFHINVSSATGVTECFFEKERFSSGDFGNVFFYPLCEDLVVGTEYDFILGVDVEAGETIRVYDEALGIFENTPFAIDVANLKPFITITSPIEDERIKATYNITWSSTDLQNDKFLQNVTLFNSSNSYVIGNNLNYTVQNLLLDTTAYADGLYTLNITVCENESTEKLCNSEQIGINITQIVLPIITIHTPIQDSTYLTSPILLNVSANEAISEWNYSLNGGTNITFDELVNISLSTSNTYTIIVYGTGAEGVATATVSFTFIGSTSGGGGITDEQLQELLDSIESYGNQLTGASVMDDIWLMLICILLVGLIITGSIKKN